MKVGLVRIGNSRGIRIPKPIIDQCGFGDTVDLRVEQNCLVIGWEKAFQAADPTTENKLLLDTIPPNEFDREYWQW
jgi:antitoxin MazE